LEKHGEKEEALFDDSNQIDQADQWQLVSLKLAAMKTGALEVPSPIRRLHSQHRVLGGTHPYFASMIVILVKTNKPPEIIWIETLTFCRP
jgi:hypothetical protein